MASPLGTIGRALSTSLTTKLLAPMFALNTIVLAIGAWVNVQNDMRTRELREMSMLNDLAQGTAGRLGETLSATRHNVEILADNFSVRRWVERPVVDPNDDLFKDVMNSLASLRASGIDRHGDKTELLFDNVYLVDLDGKILYAANDPEKYTRTPHIEADRRYFQCARAGDSYVSNALEGKWTKSGFSIYFSAPIRKAPDASTLGTPPTIGVAVLELRGHQLEHLRKHAEDLERAAELHDTSSSLAAVSPEVLVVDADGYVVSPWWRPIDDAMDPDFTARHCYGLNLSAEDIVPGMFDPNRCGHYILGNERVDGDARSPFRSVTNFESLGAQALSDWLHANLSNADWFASVTCAELPRGEVTPPRQDGAAPKNQCTPALTELGWSWRGRRALIGAGFVTNFVSDELRGVCDPHLPGVAPAAKHPRWSVLYVVDQEKFRASILKATLWSEKIALASIAAFIATCALTYFAMRRVVRSIRSLAAGANALGRGALATRIPVQGEDELGQVAFAFNDMASKLKAALEKAAEERAAADRANQAKSVFLANMSHELRTPLNAIIGYSEMLIEDQTDAGNDSAVADLQKIRSAGKHLLGLINDVLDISKIEAGKMVLYYESVDVASMIGDIVSTVKPLVAKNGNTLKVECARDLKTIRADLMKLRQSLFNLLSNATKFTKDGTITLTALRRRAAERDTMIFRVSDTGIGISEEQLGKLFKAFTQADDSTTRKYGGTGLGLVLTKKFVELMGGTIGVASKPGEGTTFTIELPVEPLSTEAAPPSSMGAGARHLLVIDDDAATRELMMRALAKEGFTVRSAGSGEEGLKMAHESKPDAILLDVLMPGMDGWAVLNSLKNDPVLNQVPVLMTTVVDDEHRGIVLGAAEYLNKPIESDRLVEVLNKHVGATGAPDKRVLVVDDDAATRRMLRRMLEGVGWTVDEADSGTIALERIERARPALVILDLMMPEMSGFEVVTRLQRSESLRDLPVVIMTAKDLTDEERSMLNKGVETIYQKGAFSRDELVAQLKALVARAEKKAS